MLSRTHLLNEADSKRCVYLGVLNPEKHHWNSWYGKNKIHTSKYTMLNFLPKNLMVQLLKAQNAYFLMVIILQSISAITTTNGRPTVASPLTIICVASMVKDALEDYAYHKNDQREND